MRKVDSNKVAEDDVGACGERWSVCSQKYGQAFVHLMSLCLEGWREPAKTDYARDHVCDVRRDGPANDCDGISCAAGPEFGEVGGKECDFSVCEEGVDPGIMRIPWREACYA